MTDTASGGNPRSEMNTGDLLGDSQMMTELRELAQRSARSSATVLIQGETGTGKELLARYIHSCSPRGDKAMISVNAGAFTPSLLESELFGHVQGAFTSADRDRQGVFETAAHSTLFLDEVGELSLSAQVRLLRVLQDGYITRVGESLPRRIDVRLIAATHRDLQQEVDSGRFRQDLFYRLNVINLRIPSLRERPDDIPLLAQNFLLDASKEYGKDASLLAPDAIQKLREHNWPGNVRELENCIRKAVIMSNGQSLTASALPAHFSDTIINPSQDSTDEAPVDPYNYLKQAMARYAEENGHHLHQFTHIAEKIMIINALNTERGVKLRAAKKLGINRVTLDRKIAEFDLNVKRGVGVVEDDDHRMLA